MGPTHLRRLLQAAALCALLALAGPGTASAGQGQRVLYTQPAWATPANDAGSVPESRDLVFSVWLGWRDQAGLEQTLSALYDPAGPSYHHWLSPDEFRSRYSPPQSQVDAVRAWLTQQGFQVLEVPQNRLFVTAEGDVQHVEQAFQVNEHLYRVDGSLVRAPDRDPAVPAALAPNVQAITGLDGALSLARPDHTSPAPPPPAGRSVGPCSNSWDTHGSSAFPNPFDPGQALPWIVCGYQPAQIDSAYGIDQLHRQGLLGQGQTIAITGAFFSPTLRQDVDHFSRRFGLPQLTGRSYREVVAPGTQRFPGDPSETQSWYIEQALDVEWAHAVAPAARIVYVGAANDARGLDQAIAYAVDQHLADVISNSWGLPEVFASRGEIGALNGVFQQAAAQGIGVYFASGDYGDNVEAAGRRSAGFPDSSPWVTSVGGTSLAVGKHGQYEFETGWGTTGSDWNGHAWTPAAPGDFLYGSGGGASHVFSQPSYQAGVVPAAQALWKGRLRRTEPDVSMVADPQTGVVFSQTYVEPNGRQKIIDSWIGGTSLATPLMAGVATLADQRTGQAHGFLNPELYKLAGTSALRDVLPSGGLLAVLRNGLDQNGKVITHLRSLDRDSSLATAPGWDPVTGLGSPVADWLAWMLR
ncbi:MAG: S53 family peptidase [Gaiellales bacterium]